MPLVDDLDANVSPPSFPLFTFDWDAIVVGAGPAGSITARELARAGMQTLLVDHAVFPRSKVCGGCLNHRALDMLKTLKLECVAFDAAPIDRFQLGHRGQIANVPIRLGVSISRRVLDTRLIEAAIADGVMFCPGTRARLLGEIADRRALELTGLGPSGIAHSRMVIAADGIGGRLTATDGTTVRMRAGSRIGAGAIVTGAIPTGSIEMAVAAGGYVGAVNLADGRVDVAAALDPKFIRQHATLGQAALAIRRDAGYADLEGLAEAVWKGTPPMTRRPARVWGHRWFAVGDAAGYVEPFTGEGMEWAIRGAIALAPIATQSAQHWSPQSGRTWQATYDRCIARRQRLCYGVARVLRSPRLSAWLIQALTAMPWLARMSMAINGGRS